MWAMLRLMVPSMISRIVSETPDDPPEQQALCVYSSHWAYGSTATIFVGTFMDQLIQTIKKNNRTRRNEREDKRQVLPTTDGNGAPINSCAAYD